MILLIMSIFELAIIYLKVLNDTRLRLDRYYILRYVFCIHTWKIEYPAKNTFQVDFSRMQFSSKIK